MELSTSTLLLTSNKPITSPYIELEYYSEVNISPTILYKEYRKGIYQQSKTLFDIEIDEEGKEYYSTGYLCLDLLEGNKVSTNTITISLETIDAGTIVDEIWFFIKNRFRKVFKEHTTINDEGLLIVGKDVICEWKL